jgi:putative addiction module component (TIGR02574 family)
MSSEGEKLLEQVLALPAEERADLLDQVTISLAADMDRLWAAEAQRRLEEVRSGKVAAIPGEAVFEEARRIASS